MNNWMCGKANSIIQKEKPYPQRLLLRPAEAAEVLAISPRLLWTLTHNNEIPCLHIGRAVRYDPQDLITWIKHRKQQIRDNNENDREIT